VQKVSPWIHLGRWALGLSGLSVGIVFGAGSLVWRLERDAPGANLIHWADCLWWAVVTLCTVGYGEHFPVTIGGRLVAIVVMICGIAIIGAVAAMIAFGFGQRFAQRLEAAVLHVESQQTSELEMLQARRAQLAPATAALQELLVNVPDAACAASLTWLLARLGWHPSTDETGLGWAQGGTRLRLAIRPWATPAGVTGRLTFTAGRPERMARISGEALRHGFHFVDPESSGAGPRSALDTQRSVLRTASGFEVALVSSGPPRLS